MPELPLTRAVAARLVARTLALVRVCPPGRVTTYGWIGAALGYPGGSGARMVGWILNESVGVTDAPAQRVINSKGELTGSWAFGRRGRMRELLEAEGISFTPAGRVDLTRYGWQPLRHLSDDERERILRETDAQPGMVTDNLLRLLTDDPASPFRVGPREPPR